MDLNLQLDIRHVVLHMSHTWNAFRRLLHIPFPIPTAHDPRTLQIIALGAPELNLFRVFDTFLEVDPFRGNADVVEGPMVNVRRLAWNYIVNCHCAKVKRSNLSPLSLPWH